MADSDESSSTEVESEEEVEDDEGVNFYCYEESEEDVEDDEGVYYYEEEEEEEEEEPEVYIKRRYIFEGEGSSNNDSDENSIEVESEEEVDEDAGEKYTDEEAVEDEEPVGYDIVIFEESEEEVEEESEEDVEGVYYYEEEEEEPEVYIKRRYIFEGEGSSNNDSDENSSSSEVESEEEMEVDEGVNYYEEEEEAEEEEPVGYDIVIFDKTVNAVYTKCQDFVNLWMSHFLYRNCDPTQFKKRKYSRRGGVRRVVGLDIQLLLESDSKYPSVATIQLCINGQCLIYHMWNATRLPLVLETFLTDPAHLFVGVITEYELRALQHGAAYKGSIQYYNLAHIAYFLFDRRLEVLRSGMAGLARKVLGKELVLPEVDPDWDDETLSEEQIIYACVGAYVSYLLGKKLLGIV